MYKRKIHFLQLSGTDIHGSVCCQNLYLSLQIFDSFLKTKAGLVTEKYSLLFIFSHEINIFSSVVLAATWKSRPSIPPCDFLLVSENSVIILYFRLQITEIPSWGLKQKTVRGKGFLCTASGKLSGSEEACGKSYSLPLCKRPMVSVTASSLLCTHPVWLPLHYMGSSACLSLLLPYRWILKSSPYHSSSILLCGILLDSSPTFIWLHIFKFGFTRTRTAYPAHLFLPGWFVCLRWPKDCSWARHPLSSKYQ